VISDENQWSGEKGHCLSGLWYLPRLWHWSVRLIKIRARLACGRDIMCASFFEDLLCLRCPFSIVTMHGEQNSLFSLRLV